MCGICGVVQVRGPLRSVIDQDQLDRMTDVMRHRGPDDRGTHRAPGMAFGARRLSIVDVQGGHQPFFSRGPAGLRHAERRAVQPCGDPGRADGQGHRFRSRCDTEILPHLYEAEGTGFVAAPPREVRACRLGRASEPCRDRAGQAGGEASLLTQVDDVVVFASELKSVLASGLVPIELDERAIDAYLSLGFVPGPYTPVAGGPQAPARPSAHRRGRRGRASTLLAVPRPTRRRARTSAAEYTEELLELLREAMRLRLMSDVPLGAMLSGGLDSSLVVALDGARSSASRSRPSASASARMHGSELEDARKVGPRFGTDHHELELSFLDDTVGLEELVWHLDEPVADLSALGLLALSELARRHVTVALSGQGADELFAGYERYRNAALIRRWQALPGWCRPAAAGGSAPRARGTHAAQPSSSRPKPRSICCSRMSGRRSGVDRCDARAEERRSAAREMLERGSRRSRPISTRSSTALFLDAQLSLAGRHAPLLRPNIDGAFARGAGALPRPRARRDGRRAFRRSLKVSNGQDEAHPEGGRERLSARPRSSTSRRSGSSTVRSTHGSSARRRRSVGCSPLGLICEGA